MLNEYLQEINFRKEERIGGKCIEKFFENPKLLL